MLLLTEFFDRVLAVNLEKRLYFLVYAGAWRTRYLRII